MRKYSRLALAVVPLIMVLVMSDASIGPHASALTLYSFKGVVSDALGRPLSGATVTDGSQHTTTAANGSYSLGESSTGNFNLSAFRSDVVEKTTPVNVTVPLDTTVNFTLLYRIAGTMSSSALSTASGPAGSTLTITEFAPNPGTPGGSAGNACVSVTDSRTTTTTPATLVQTNSDGSSQWTYQLSLPQRTNEGTYSLSYLAADCSTGTALTATGTSNYVVDNSPPSISAVLPADGGNTVFSSQPLSANIADTGGSGLNPSSVVFSLTDTTTGSTSTLNGSAVSWNATTGSAKTTPVSLTTGHLYQLSLSASDAAGNTVTDSQSSPTSGGGFALTTEQISATNGSIPPTTCSVASQPSTSTGMKAVTCPNVPIHLDATTASLGDTRRAGEVFVHQTVPLSSATLNTTQNGVTLSVPAGLQSGNNDWQPKVITSGYLVPSTSTTSQTYPVPQYNTTVGQLAAQVPAAWPSTTATLKMSPVTTSAASTACADPSTSASPCFPDPVRSQPTTIWDPPPATTHVGPCDTAVTHHESVAWQPGADRSLALSVDTTRLTASQVSLSYQINGQTPQTLSTLGTGASSYTFTIPGASLPEGASVAYVFNVAGSFRDQACASYNGAASPSNHGYVSYATATATRANVPFSQTAMNAVGDLADGPGVAHTASALCAQFASPTPCDLFPSTNQGSILGPTLPSSLAQLSLARLPTPVTPMQVPHVTINSSEGPFGAYYAPGMCAYAWIDGTGSAVTSRTWWWNASGGTQQSTSGAGATTDANNQPTKPSTGDGWAEYTDAKGIYLPSSASIDNDGAAGFGFRFSDNANDTFPLGMYWYWDVKGQSKAYGVPGFFLGSGSGDASAHLDAYVYNAASGQSLIDQWQSRGASSGGVPPETVSEDTGNRYEYYQANFPDGTAFDFWGELRSHADANNNFSGGAEAESDYLDTNNPWRFLSSGLLIEVLDYPNHYIPC